ncbi:probable casein kinase I homolog ECU11_1980 [Contarinia nasturtii]|uniref:probable casein kinase I homolog ECU11_1980 n=1 Tax=Contarinia nasturtii TaxID=265458 RepID=UPI0012D45659|nr:probable casein kinase I homolog ECU11_1980 [Contarinia nasturtii]
MLKNHFKIQFLTFLLLIGFSIIEADEDDIRDKIEDCLSSNGGKVNGSDIMLLPKELGFSGASLVWAAKISHIDVAVKICMYNDLIKNELAVYRALNAVGNPKIEEKGIPNVYEIGKLFGYNPFIAITRFDGNVQDRLKNGFTMFGIVYVFLHSVKALSYIHSKGVIHNDIKPENIFIRGNAVFISDFDNAALPGKIHKIATRKFASSGWWAGNNRRAMDDLESLVYTIWYMVGINSFEPEGLVMKKKSANGKKAFVLEKCKYFARFEKVHKACNFICNDEMLSGKATPNHAKIVEQLEEALAEVKRVTKQTQFE